MKLVSYLYDGHDHLALLVDGLFYDMENLHPDIPNTMGMFLQYWDDAYSMSFGGELMIKDGNITPDSGNDPSVAELVAPVPFPPSFRDAFPSQSSRPSFHFLNHHSIKGPGGVACMPEHLNDLRFSPRVGIVIGKQGRNIEAAQADDFIAGLMLINTFIAGDLLQEETGAGGGPGKSSDFATSSGPWLVTTEELTACELESRNDQVGKVWDIQLKCLVNGQETVTVGLSDMKWTFAELIARASYGVDLYPGDVISSGPLGSARLFPIASLKDGDIVEIISEQLGTLSNEVIATEF